MPDKNLGRSASTFFFSKHSFFLKATKHFKARKFSVLGYFFVPIFLENQIFFSFSKVEKKG